VDKLLEAYHNDHRNGLTIEEVLRKFVHSEDIEEYYCNTCKKQTPGMCLHNVFIFPIFLSYRMISSMRYEFSTNLSPTLSFFTVLVLLLLHRQITFLDSHTAGCVDSAFATARDERQRRWENPHVGEISLVSAQYEAVHHR